MDLATLHSDVSAALKRGNSQDTSIPRWVRNAVRWLEQNNDFEYMHVFADVTLDASADAPNVLEWDNTRVKRVDFVQPYAVGIDQGRVYDAVLQRIDRRQFARITPGAPTTYWQTGPARFVFDAIPTVDILLEMAVYEYTDWPTAPDAEPLVLARYDNLVFYQAMVDATVEIKDPAATQQWRGLRDETLAAVLAAEDNAKYSGTRLVMGGFRGRRA